MDHEHVVDMQSLNTTEIMDTTRSTGSQEDADTMIVEAEQQQKKDFGSNNQGSNTLNQPEMNEEREQDLIINHILQNIMQ